MRASVDSIATQGPTFEALYGPGTDLGGAAGRTNSSFARFSNDARGSAQFNNNARFTPGAHNRQPIMRAGRVITAGVEIFTNYGGGGYWNNNNAQ